jgi:hypothetical protein
MFNFPRGSEAALPVLAGTRIPVDRRTARSLVNLERVTRTQLARTRAEEVVRVNRVVSEAIVATVKTQEVDRVAREAVSGQAMLRHYSDTVVSRCPVEPLRILGRHQPGGNAIVRCTTATRLLRW